MSGQKHKRLDDNSMRQRALARWENEGGAVGTPGRRAVMEFFLSDIPMHGHTLHKKLYKASYKGNESMANKKETQLPGRGKLISPRTAEMLSKQQEAYQKLEQQHFPVEDKRQVARREHTNGSTPAKRA